MRRIATTMLAAAALTGAAFTAASAESVAALTDLNMRSGPGTGYERVTTLPKGARAELGECTDDLHWCELTYGPIKGWASSHYLSEPSDAPASAPRVAAVEPQPLPPRYQPVPEDPYYAERIVRVRPRDHAEYRPPVRYERRVQRDFQEYPNPGDELIGPAGGYADAPQGQVYLRVYRRPYVVYPPYYRYRGY